MERREIVVNTLCGALILTAAIVISFLAIAPVVLAINWFPKLFTHFLPGINISKSIGLLALFGGSSLISLVGFLRQRVWQNAFLSFVTIAVIFSAWLAQTRQPQLRDDFVPTLLPLILLMPMSRTTPSPRLNFILASIFGAAILTFNFGLVSAEPVRHGLVGCAVLVCLVVRARQGWDEKSPGPQAPLAPTNA